MPGSASLLQQTQPVELRWVAPPAARPSIAAKGSIALDQWRGLALVLVLINHGFFFTNRVAGAGRIGVNLFFFISGILSYRSLAHRSSENTWNLIRSFWWRRLRRLYPALIAYVFTMLIAVVFLQRLPNRQALSDLGSYLRYLPYVLTYTINYTAHRPLALWHLWSLACEMQFYTVAPLIFLLGGKGVYRRTLVFGAIALGFAAFGLIYPLRSPHYELVKYHFELAAWPMMVGFACEFAKRWFSMISRVYVNACFGLGAAALIIALIAMLFGLGMKIFVVATGGFLLFPCMLAYVFGLPLPGRPGKYLAWIGERTYSIYLWQEPLTICFFLPPILHPLGALLSIPVGALSFRIFEKPFLSAGRARQVSAVARGLPVQDPA
jgi:peptidoglycan/LPS O-acetylase OafA/YrhL